MKWIAPALLPEPQFLLGRIPTLCNICGVTRIRHTGSTTGRRHAPADLGAARWLLIALTILCASSRSPAQQVHDDKNPTAQWEILENCQLITNVPVDGDSFHLVHDGREYIFRLYFVDAPEKDPTLRDRIVDQAEYFGIAKDTVPRAGALAARFTRDKLTGHKLTVITRWQNAMGRSSLARFYCILRIGEENLAESLVASGFARIHGLRANYPDGPRSTTFIAKLKNLELTAREKKLGVWDETQFPRVAVADTTGSTNAPIIPTATDTSTTNTTAKTVDLNSATTEELMSLPAIGPKMAERIEAGRPFTSVEDLQRVPGIGPKTLEKLRPLVHVKPARNP